MEIQKHGQRCCGCEACAQACPRACITMQTDAEGFRYPKVDHTLCVGCGACERACPLCKPVETSDAALAAYAARTLDDDVRRSSSSGGVFYELARSVLLQGGVVYGVAMGEDFTARHIAVESMDGLPALMGSKYVQSRTDNAFRGVQDALNAGRRVLFTGTACQVAGLKAYLGREREGLITVDVLCHGVASPLLLQRYIEYEQRMAGSRAESISFRDKSRGWHDFSVRLHFDDREKAQVFRENPFFRLYLSNVCLRPACYECRFRAMKRPSDLTIGDAWGVEHIMPELDDNTGTSVVIVRTDAGGALLEEIRPRLLCREGALDALLPPHADSRKAAHPHEKRPALMRKLADPSADFPALCKAASRTLPEKILYRIRRAMIAKSV